MKIIKTARRIVSFIIRGFKFLWREHRLLVPPRKIRQYFFQMINKIRNISNNKLSDMNNMKDYNEWLKNEEVSEFKELKYNPLISFAIPVYNIEKEFLEDCLDSILNQTYTNFEVILSDDCSTKKETIKTLKKYEKKDSRIKVVYRKENGHISKATNSALELAKGEYVALMDDDDILPTNTLYECVKALNENPKIDMIYTDEDKIDMKDNRCEPHFKSDFAPDSLLGGNYICHFPLMRKSILDEVGYLKHEFVGAQDFDLFIRFSEKAKVIKHIPKLLYHWRKVPGSTADTIENKDYAIENGRRAVEDALKRRGLEGEVYSPIKCTHYVVNYRIKKQPLVSIIINDNNLNLRLKKCLESIHKNTNYENIEVIISNNNLHKKKLINKYKKIFKTIKSYKEKDINKLVEKAKGEYIAFIDSNVKVKSDNWLENMLGYAARKDIGVVGPKIDSMYGTIYSAGIVINKENLFNHVFRYYDKNSYGNYGRMLVPYNYSALSGVCFMIEKKKLVKAKLFDNELTNELKTIDLCLKINKKYNNVFLPQVEVSYRNKYDFDSYTTSEKEYFSKKWKKEIKEDKYYNKNLSDKRAFMLD